MRLNQSGFSLIEVIVVVALMAIVAVGSAQLMVFQSRVSSVNTFQSSQILLKQDLLATISNQASWDQMKQKNASMACLLSHTCTNGQGGPVALYDVSGNLVYDSTKPSAGFTTKGDSCATFTANGNDQCPIHVDVTWQASCDPAIPSSCENPSELVSIAFVSKFNTPHQDFQLRMGGLNVENHFRQNLTTETPVVRCASQGKFFIGVGNKVSTYDADTSGCVPLDAFKGAPGPAGPAGPQGVPAN